MTKPHDPLLDPVKVCLQRGSEGTMLVTVTHRLRTAGMDRFMQQLFMS